MLFGFAIIISILGYMPLNEATKGIIFTISLFAVPSGLLICLIGLIMVFKDKSQ